ncbi:MAG: diguanylate cyclase [Ferrimonas sp.]
MENTPIGTTLGLLQTLTAQSPWVLWGWSLVVLLVVILAVGGYYSHQQRHRLQALLHLAQGNGGHDGLTDLPTQILMLDRLQLALARHQRLTQQLAVLIVQVEPAQLCGRQEQAWQQRLVAHWLPILRSSDSLGRWGTNQFMVILENQRSVEGARAVASGLIRSCNEIKPNGDLQQSACLHIGIALFPNHGTDALELIQAANHSRTQAWVAGNRGFAVA